MEQLLNKLGLNFEDLTKAEKESYFSLVEAMKDSVITPERLRDNISQMKFAVEEELINEPEFVYIWFIRIENRKHIYLKARLKNYMLLESFLMSSERTKRMIENSIGKK